MAGLLEQLVGREKTPRGEATNAEKRCKEQTRRNIFVPANFGGTRKDVGGLRFFVRRAVLLLCLLGKSEKKEYYSACDARRVIPARMVTTVNYLSFHRTPLRSTEVVCVGVCGIPNF